MIPLARHSRSPQVACGDTGNGLSGGVRNALRSMPLGGRLEVTLARAEDRWCIRFADTGEGLTPPQVEKVFEPFQTQLEGDTGLGLAIVYQTLQAHDARISVHSSPGKGMEFFIEMKRSEPAGRKQPETVQITPVIDHPNVSAAAELGASGVKHG